MAPSIKTLTALAALLLAVPGASALAATAGVTSTPSPPSVTTDGTTGVVDGVASQVQASAQGAINTVHPVIQTVQDAADGADGALDTVKGLLDCRAAVHVHLDWYGGKVTNSRSNAGDLLVPYAVVSQVTQSVPRYETVTQTVMQVGGGLLDNVLPPVTQTVTKLVGYDVTTVTKQVPADLAVAASWKEEYVVWAAYSDDFYVSPLVTVALPGANVGPVQLMCDPATTVHDHMLTPTRAGVDLYCICSERPADGWYTRILSMQVGLADAADYQAAWQGQGTIIAPQDVTDAAVAKAKTMHFTPDQLTAQSAARATAGRPDAPVPTAEMVTPHTAGCSLNVPFSTGMVLGSFGFGLLSFVGLAAQRILRRRTA